MRREDWADGVARELGDFLLDERATGEAVIERIAQELRKSYLAGLEDVDVSPDVEHVCQGSTHLYRPSIPADAVHDLTSDEGKTAMMGSFVNEHLSRMTWVGRKTDPAREGWEELA